MKAVLGRRVFLPHLTGNGRAQAAQLACPVGHRAGTKEGVSLDERNPTKEIQVFLISS